MFSVVSIELTDGKQERILNRKFLKDCSESDAHQVYSYTVLSRQKLSHRVIPTTL